MKRVAGGILLVALILTTANACFAQSAGKITGVVVYQGQALVTRDVQFEAKAGAQEVQVTELPQMIVPDSLYATGDANLAIRAVRFHATATREEVRPEVRKLETELKQAQQEEKRIASELSVLENKSKFLDKLDQFATMKTNEEVAKGTLNPGALQEIATFAFAQRDETAAKKLKLETEQEAQKSAIDVLQRKIRELAGPGVKTALQAIVFLDATKAGPAKLQLSYLVNSVGWTPAYSARLNAKKDRLALEYHAALTQTSGEDWPDVDLVLSTSHPRMLAAAPILSPLRITLVSGAPQEQEAALQFGYADKARQIQQRIRGPKGERGAVGPAGPKGDAGPAGPAGMGMMGGMMPGGMGGGMMGPSIPAQRGLTSSDRDYLAANVAAAELQNLELTAPDDAVRLSKAIGAATTEGLAVDYPITGKISIQSRTDQQMFHITTLDLKAKFNYIAVPLLTDYVYQSVECVNDSEYPLLAGPYNAYVEGAFAGRGEIALVARGQGLTLGFGTETRLRASRELDEKTTSTRGGNKIVQYKYKLRLSNYMATPVNVRVWDRLPKAPDTQVTVQLVNPDPALSTDALYVSQQRPRGLLRWDVDVPANASGAKVHSFDYQFQVEFDKNYDIGGLPEDMAQEMEEDMAVMKQIQSSAAAMQ